MNMLDIEQIIGKVNQRIAEIQNRIGSTTGSRTGTESRDRMFGSDGDDFIDGLGGNDQIFGNFGNDVLLGGNGADLIVAGFGNDYLEGGEGNDRLFGDFDDDLVFGGNGNDTLDGSVGSDVLFGGDGNDNISGGTNGAPDAPEFFFEDYLIGGTGSDVLNGFAGGRGNTEIDWLIGGGSVDANGFIDSDANGNPINIFDGARDLYVLGNSTGAFYTSAEFGDYALIFGFEVGIDQLQLGSGVQHVSVPTSAFEVSFGSTDVDDTFIFALFPDGRADLVAATVDVSITLPG